MATPLPTVDFVEQEISMPIKKDTQLPVADFTPDEIAELEKQANQGLSKSSEDNLVPLVYVLQRMSPQVIDVDPRYLDGAKPGDIWLRNAPQPIIKGAEGMVFQPCYFAMDWVEWVPREKGGGFIGRHGILENPNQCPVADAARQADPQNPNRVKYIRPNGNEVIQTRNHVGYVLNHGSALPYVIPMSSSGHTVSRQWMMRMNSRQLPSGNSAPAYAYCYRLATRQRSNPKGSWFTWEINDERACNREERDRGEQLFQSFQRNERTVAIPDQQPDAIIGADDDAPM